MQLSLRFPQECLRPFGDVINSRATKSSKKQLRVKRGLLPIPLKFLKSDFQLSVDFFIFFSSFLQEGIHFSQCQGLSFNLCPE